jgi:type II secretory pathway pseudopilin PulG
MKTQRGSGIHGTKSSSVAPAFTRLELAAVLAALVLLAALALPVLANNRERSQRVVCVNNLRLVGQATQEWGTDREGKVPWQILASEGGTRVVSSPAPPWNGLQNNAWFQWAWMSNELRTPKILACPSDTVKSPARDWSASADGGLLHPAFQNTAVSYLVNLHPFPEHEDALLSGDRNLRGASLSGNCSAGISPVQLLPFTPSPSFGIDPSLHVEAGNFLFSDGRVEELSDRGIVRRLLEVYAGIQNKNVHYLKP